MEPVLITFYELLMAVGVKNFCVSSTQWSKVPVDAVVSVVVTVLTVLSVGVVGVDAVDCDSVVKVVGVVALSENITGHILIVEKRALHVNFIFIEMDQSVVK